LDAPSPRGPLSGFLLEELTKQARTIASGPSPGAGDALSDDDIHLSLAICYELHNGGLAWADERWEWEPSLIGFRANLERRFEEALLREVGRTLADGDVPAALRRMVANDDGPSLSAYMGQRATPEQFAEFMVHRSHYQLREADPHTWAIPRLRGRGKAALVMVQADEYGGGREERMHSSLFRRSMEAFELDTREGAYLDLLPGITLATVNLMHLFGLHRRWRGAIAGHLAVFEMTSTGPNRRYGDGLRRLGFGGNATEFFDEHVTADAVHEIIACDQLAGSVASESPSVASDVLFGAGCLLALEARFARHLLCAWERNETSLRRPLFATLAA
jgi:hypothetical protein